ncbi:MAG: hypothetical protein ACOCVR_03260 [Myxococcota bacterium]
MRVLTVLSFVVLAAAGCSSSKPIQYQKTFSYGLEDEDAVYFLLEYKVWRARAPVWFIMPIERSPEIFFQEIYLYRYQPETQRLEKLATVRDDFPPGVSIRSTKLTGDDGDVIFAYQAGNSLERGILYEVRIWDRAGRRLLSPDPEGPSPTDSPLHERYFGEYRSPWTDNPGIMPISDVKALAAGAPEEDWDLPAEW